MTLAVSPIGSGLIIIEPSIKKQAIIGVCHSRRSVVAVAISLKLMLEDGDDKPPWKSSSIENGMPTKKLDVSCNWNILLASALAPVRINVLSMNELAVS